MTSDCTICNGPIRSGNHRTRTVELSRDKLEEDNVHGKDLLEAVIEEHGEGPVHDTCFTDAKLAVA